MVRTCIALGVLALSLGSGTAAQAAMSGGCHASTVGSRSGSVDLVGAEQLHLYRDEVVTFRGIAPAPQTSVQITVYLFGFPVTSPTIGGFKETTETYGPVAVSSLSRYVRAVALSATTDSCSTSLLVAIDDQSPLLTVAGLAAAILGLLGLLGVFRAARGKGHIGSRILGGFAGLLAGVGWSFLLQQMLWIDPRSFVGLYPVVLGLLVGILLAGSVRRTPATVLTAPPTAAAPPTATGESEPMSSAEPTTPTEPAPAS
jgi:hypothetical protein